MKNAISSLAFLLFASCGIECSAQTVSGQIDGYDYVDLGLSVKWATFNVGATQPTELGNYFAWGEVAQKDSSYNWSTYKWCEGSFDSITRYCVKRKLGKRDKYTQLIPADDAATANWGAKWRMPSILELQELVDNCKWDWTSNYKGSGTAGSIGTSKINGNTIFLPAAGFREDTMVGGLGVRGQYMSNQIADFGNCDVHYIWFGDSSIETDDNIQRQIGNSVRAVTK